MCQQLVRARLLKRRLRCGHIRVRRLHRGLGSVQAGHRFVPGLIARNSLLGKRDCTRGIGLLMFQVRLSLRQRRLARLHLRFGVDRRT